MVGRLIRTKFLLLVAAVITLLALYKRISWSNSQHVKHFNKLSSHAIPMKSISINHSDFHHPPADMPVDKSAAKNILENEKTLYQKALDINFKQNIHNKDTYGEHTPESVIIVVQVHNRPQYFQELINSLRKVRNIDKATLVVSMDKFSKPMEDIISSIDFCRFMVIFFPFSMQLFPDSFPGESPNDCPRDLSKAEAISRKCNNADYPDKYGHYREVKFVQTKHHWMWKLHMVFRGIPAFSGNLAPVILLEEDYFVLPDLIYCAKLALELKNSRCQKCGFISLGNYEPEPSTTQTSAHHVEIRSWISSKSNMGLVFSQATYKLLYDCSDAICDFDDYNWDWSLQAAMKSKIPDKLFTMQFKATRVYHLGSCGGMHSKKTCDLTTELEQIEKQIKNLPLFPEQLHIALDNPASSPMPKENGGWGDLRDRTLCKSFRTMYNDGSR